MAFIDILKKKKKGHDGLRLEYTPNSNDSNGKALNQKFSYDPDTDNAYQAYKEAYERQSGAAMRNTLGNIAALTGGRPSSYAGTAASQAYSKTMAGLYDKVPQLIDVAYNRYNADRKAKLDQEKFSAEKENESYQRFYNDRNFYKNESEDDRDFNYKTERDKVSDEQWEKNYSSEINKNDFQNDLNKRKQQLSENKYTDSKNAFDYNKVAKLAEDFKNSDDPKKWLNENAKYLTAEEYNWIVSVFYKSNKQK